MTDLPHERGEISIDLTAETGRPIRVWRYELHFDFARGSGPGGQNVNKVNSKAVLKWTLAGAPGVPADVRQRFRDQFNNRIAQDGSVTLHSNRFRDQPRNLADCIAKLHEMLLEVAVPPKERKATKPTRSSKARRVEGKRRHADLKGQRRMSRKSYDD